MKRAHSDPCDLAVALWWSAVWCRATLRLRASAELLGRLGHPTLGAASRRRVERIGRHAFRANARCDVHGMLRSFPIRMRTFTKPPAAPF